VRGGDEETIVERDPNSKAAGRPDADGFALSPLDAALQASMLENTPSELVEPAARSG
jgi:hypothetical protein